LKSRPSPLRLSSRLSAFGNAGEAQAGAVILTVFRQLEWIRGPELLDGKIRFERQQLIDVGGGLFVPAKMAQRGDQRFVAIDEIRNRSHDASTNDNGPFVVALEHVSHCVCIFKKTEIGIERSEIAITTQPP